MLAALGMVALVVGAGTPAAAAEDCGRTVIFTLPGITWEDVQRVKPPHFLQVADEGAAGSVSVRTISSRTSYGSGFATIGAGSRVDAPRAAGAAAGAQVRGVSGDDVRVVSASYLADLAGDAGYDAEPGALAEAVSPLDVIAVGNADRGTTTPSPAGYGRWTTLAAMDADGFVDVAAVGPGLLVKDTTAPFGVVTDANRIGAALRTGFRDPCGVLIVDQGDLTRADEWALTTGRPETPARERALRAADELLGDLVTEMDRNKDLLMVISPTSPWWDDEVHLGVAVARGPGFDAGATLESASTRRAGIVTLPDVAPTVLEFLGAERPPEMIGRPWVSVPSSGDRMGSAVDLDRESIFVEGLKTPVSAAFVVFQVAIYLLAIFLFTRGSTARRGSGLRRAMEPAVLAITAFPVSTYLAGTVDGHSFGALWYLVILVAVAAALVAVTMLLLSDPLDRLLAITAFTTMVIFVDLFVGAPLQMNTVLGYSPVVAGRFAGLGNIGFAVLGAAAVLTGALIAQRWSPRRGALIAAGGVFVAAVIVDGAPPWGSDVGGVLTLVPALGIAWLLLAGRRPTWRTVALAGLAAVVALGAFLAFDLSRPSTDQTHLARLYDDIQQRGLGVFGDTVQRKVSANLRLFRSSIWTYFVPPALIAIALLMRRPRGRWQRVASTYPKLRAGLVGGLVLAVIGFAANDSGIVIPAVVLSFLVPAAVLMHLELERAERAA